MSLSISETSRSVTRAPPGGKDTISLGTDNSAWTTTSNNHVASAAAAVQSTPRKPPGGASSVQFGGPMEALAATELLARPSPGGADSITFGKDNGESLPASQLLARASPGGEDSIKFGGAVDAVSSETLLARAYPGGSTTVVLGGYTQDWSTNSQAQGVGCAAAAAAFEAPARGACGGVDSVNFNAAEECKVNLETLLSRPSPGGVDTMDFLAPLPGASPSSETLLARPFPGGGATVVLGGDRAQWTTNSQVHGVGSVEAVATAEATLRQAPGGVDSINFSAEQQGSLSAEVLMARPSPGGADEIVLGGEKGNWVTNSSSLGAGSVEAIAQAEPRARQAPGGTESVASGVATLSAQELMARPATGGGGKASIVLGGDNNDWVTSSDTHGTCEMSGADVVERQAPGGTDSVVFGASDACKFTVDQLLARPAPGGAASVNFSQVAGNTLGAAELMTRQSCGGAASVVLGTDFAAWATSSQKHSNAACETTSVESVRQPPGGTSSVCMGMPQESGLSAETLRARRACGGAATVVLGGDASAWTTNSSAVGVGCGDAATTTAAHATAHNAPGNVDSVDLSTSCQSTPAKPKPMRVMMCSPIGGTATLNLEDIAHSPEPGTSSNRFACGSNQNQGNVLTDRSTTRLMQAPGGNSSICLGDGSAPVAGTSTSANRFANGSNQNEGNWITDRATTRCRQAPGGTSSINLGDTSTTTAHDVGVAASRFPKGRQYHAPGGASSMILGDEKAQRVVQDENVNCGNAQQTSQEGAEKLVRRTQAPGGVSNLVLG